ncbi:MAG TPA: aminopeptidase [Lutibacter sp.]|nr:aminopeptidase [Lutibacter sp.]
MIQKFGHIVFLFLGLVSSLNIFAQNDQIEMRVSLHKELHSLHIQQIVTYFNHSKDTLNQLFFHDWNNAFSDKNTALGKRFIENYKKKFFFAKDKDRGSTEIKNLLINNKSVVWNRPDGKEDFLEVVLDQPLFPADSLIVNFRYTVKIPKSKFTSYGVNKDNYNLRYWHIVPVVYDKTWQLMHHLNMDDLHQNPTDYTVNLQVPKEYFVSSNLKIFKKSDQEYKLSGLGKQDFQLQLSQNNEYNNFELDKEVVSTNLNDIELSKEIKNDILNRQLDFLKKHLGDYSHDKIFINKTSYDKNPLYGMNQLPSFLRPFSDTFTWDLRMFKTLSQEYINTSLHSQNRKNTWFRNGVHSYMMMQYVNQFYPEVKLIGNVSKLWGIKSYHISELDFNSKYNIVFQHIASTNHDQALTTPSDSLTNFNRLIFQKHKAGLAIRYLDAFLGDSIVAKAIQQYFNTNLHAKSGKSFKEYIVEQTNKDVNWFFDTFIQTDKEIDYSLTKTSATIDSTRLTIKNKRDLTLPIPIYGISKEGVKTKQWLTNIQQTQSISLANDSIKYWSLNYNSLVPEINLRNNKVNNKWSFFKKPLKIRWLNDIDDPTKNQLYIEPKTDFNLYDGIILATSIKNKNSLHKNFTYSITPAYSFRGKSLTGSVKALYHKYLENSIINSYKLGVGGSYFHYQPNLAYKKLTPFAQVFFKRKNLRSVKSSSLSMGFTLVDKEVDIDENTTSEFDKYKVFRLSYNYQNPEIIDNFSHSTNLEIGEKYTKLYADIRYRKLTNYNQQFGVRFFAGTFLNNNTQTDFFSYGVNRPNDYLFKYGYFGRTETDGIFSQQIIINDAGFKSQMPVGFANQWMTSLNTSIGIWRWFEIYNDVGLIKNRNQKVFFAHDKGVRLNFVNDIFEIYLPLHSNNGWEITQPHYEKRIRFVFKAHFSSIYNFVKRGFL